MASVEAHLRVTPKTDLWSLGILLVVLLTGEYPWIVEEGEEGLDPYTVLLSVLKFAGNFHLTSPLNSQAITLTWNMSWAAHLLLLHEGLPICMNTLTNINCITNTCI